MKANGKPQTGEFRKAFLKIFFDEFLPRTRPFRLGFGFTVIFCSLVIFPSNADYFLDQAYFFPLKIKNLHSRGSTIVCLGDSLTYGVGASPGHDYPSLLSKALGMEVINAGVDGDETEDALKRLDRDVLSKNPRLVIILLGANDYLDGVPVSKAFQNLDEIVRRIQAQGAMVVVGEIGTSIFGSALQRRWDHIVTTHQVAYVPRLLGTYFFNPTLKSDNLHPNDKGYEIIAEHMLQVVKPLLAVSSAEPMPQEHAHRVASTRNLERGVNL